MPAAETRTTEDTFHATPETMERATEIYSCMGLTLSDAINMFLIKSIEVGGLPFNMRPEKADA